MLSRYTWQNRLIYGRRILFMNLCQVPGAPVSLNGITRDLNKLSFVWKAVRYSRPFLIRMLLKAATISTFEKYLIPFRLFRVSFVRGSG
jgi:hypothetical protein